MNDKINTKYDRKLIHSSVILEGRVVIGNNVTIGPYCIIRDSIIHDNVVVKEFSTIDSSEIKESCSVGPYARLRNDTILESNVQIGNFVEIKRSIIYSNSSVNHHAFIGDTEVGVNVTIGAGFITCNHNGVSHVPCHIKEGVYIGSGVKLIAPIVIGEFVTVAAGSVITQDVPPRSLVIARSRQVIKENYILNNKGKTHVKT